MLEGSDFPLSENPKLAELARELLLYRMQEYSEAMCASWLSGAEYDIWELGESVGADPKEAAWLRQIGLDCRKLCRLASGWWVYDSNDKAAARENAWTGQNPHFITLTEWKERYTAWREERLPHLQDQAKAAAARGMEPEAAVRWAQVPAGEQAALLNQVWCAHCRTCQPLHPSGGCAAFIGKGLWITGTCPGCGGLLRVEYRGRTVEI